MGPCSSAAAVLLLLPVLLLLLPVLLLPVLRLPVLRLPVLLLLPVCSVYASCLAACAQLTEEEAAVLRAHDSTAGRFTEASAEVGEAIMGVASAQVAAAATSSHTA